MLFQHVETPSSAMDPYFPLPLTSLPLFLNKVCVGCVGIGLGGKEEAAEACICCDGFLKGKQREMRGFILAAGKKITRQ